MIGSNLPPGCRESDIPGNTPEDARFEKWFENTLFPMLQETEDVRERISAVVDQLNDGQDVWENARKLRMLAEELIGLGEDMERAHRQFLE